MRQRCIRSMYFDKVCRNMIRKDKPIDSNDMVRVKITQEIIISAKKIQVKHHFTELSRQKYDQILE